MALGHTSPYSKEQFVGNLEEKIQEAEEERGSLARTGARTERRAWDIQVPNLQCDLPGM